MNHSSTIALAPVVAFLRKHNAVSILDGAPVCYRHNDFDDWGVYREMIGALYTERDPKAGLYLGTGPVCPAAEGWAARVLALCRHVRCDAAIEVDQRVTIWGIGRDEPTYRWAWDFALAEPMPYQDGVWLPGHHPATPTERLAAVLRYELERNP